MVTFRKNNLGFTLIEMIVSLGVFSIVVTIAVGAMLMLIATNQQLQGEQSVMTNLAFALDTMTREIRTGYNYVCAGVANDNVGVNGLTPILTGQPPRIFDVVDHADDHEKIGERTKDCNGRGNSEKIQGISFYEGGDSITSKVTNARRIIYYYDSSDPNNKTIMRRVGNGPAQAIVSSGLVVQNAEFYVTGSTPQSIGGDAEQPTVTIYIEAQEKDDPSEKKYYLQTTVTQRTLDL